MDPDFSNAILSTADSYGYNFNYFSDRQTPAQQQDIINALHVIGNCMSPQPSQSNEVNQQPDYIHSQAAAAASQAPITTAMPQQFDAREISAMADNSARLQMEEAARSKAEKLSKKTKRVKPDEATRTSTREKKKPDYLQVSSTEEDDQPDKKLKKAKKERTHNRDKH